MNIIVTGGAGFIANSLIKNYINDNIIIAYDNYHRDTLSSSSFASHPNLKIVKGDVMDLALLTESMKGADIVIHAAGIAGIAGSSSVGPLPCPCRHPSSHPCRCPPGWPPPRSWHRTASPAGTCPCR